MKRFTFRLDALKRLAVADEGLQQIEVARCEQSLRDALDLVEAGEAAGDAARARLQALVDTARALPSDVSLALHEMDDAARLSSRARGEAAQRQRAADEARVRLEEHVMHRRMLERLEVRAHDAYALEAGRVEQKDMDELALRADREGGE